MEKTRTQLPKTIDPRVITAALDRMDAEQAGAIRENASRLAGIVRIRENKALDLILRCAWAKMDKLDVAASLCRELNGKGGADDETN